jgi:hypothetical protein
MTKSQAMRIVHGTEDYAESYAKHTNALRAFHKVREAYRNRTIGDAEFIAARQVYFKATALFEIAAEKESARGELI